MTAASKPARRLTYRPEVGVLWIEQGADSKAYYVDRVHGAQGGAAYSLYKVVPPEKADEPREYAVLLADDGRDSCECKGFLHGGHKRSCRHLAALRCLAARRRLP